MDLNIFQENQEIVVIKETKTNKGTVMNSTMMKVCNSNNLIKETLEVGQMMMVICL